MADDKDIYSEEGREELVESDEISPREEGFMEGAHDDGQGAKCRKCGKILMDNFIERKLDDEFISEEEMKKKIKEAKEEDRRKEDKKKELGDNSKEKERRKHNLKRKNDRIKGN